MAWLGVITNDGNDVLKRWVEGKTLNITRAACGQGRVSEVSMLAQTSLVNEKQTASIVSNEPVDGGQRLKLQVTPQTNVKFPINQFGVWASLENEEAKMIALFQTDTDIGIEIPGKEEMPDFVYTFYGLLAFYNQGELTVNIDAAAVVTEETMKKAVGDGIAAHNKEATAHKELFDKKADLENGKVKASQLPKNEANGVAGLGADGKVGTAQLPVNQANGVAGLGTDGKVSADLLPNVGVAPQIVATYPTGATVTCTKDGKTYTGTQQGGKWVFEVDDYGSYVLTATRGGETTSRNVNVAVVQQYFVTLAFFEATITVNAPVGATVTCTKGSEVQTEISNGTVIFTVAETGTYTLRAEKDGQETERTTTITADGQTVTVTLAFFAATITVTAPIGATVTCTKGSDVQTETSTGTIVFTVPETGTYTLRAEMDGDEAEDTATITADGQEVSVTLAFVHIYGVEWDGSSTTVWSRTDESAEFSDPVPYLKGASSYGSPFDNLMPWSGMVRSTDAVAGELVAIPKFWFKLAKNGNGLKLQIADKAEPGFFVSPAHADRGDGKGERDVVYIGRYHCVSGYKSATGAKPLANITRSTARSGIHALGETIWQSDIQLRMTLWMLYLVEFADWNTQKTIGKGCGNNSGTENMGYTDSMPYHTGTTLASRDSYGLGTQYRNIEGLWDNVVDWGDGCYYNASGLNIIQNPANFSDSTGGTLVGKPSSGYPSAFAVATVNGLEWCIYPTAAEGSETTYSADYWYFDGSGPCLYFGGSYNQDGYRGLFYVSCKAASDTNAAFGCRLQKLP